MNPTLVYARVGCRGFQFLFALMGMAFTAAGFYVAESFAHSTMLGSAATTFGILMNYTAMLYSLWFVLAVEVLHYAQRPSIQVVQVLDGLMSLVLFIAGIVLATSDFVSDCSFYGYMLKCGNLTAGVVMTFLSMAFFMGTLALSVMQSNQQQQKDASLEQDNAAMDDVPQAIPYHAEATPTGNLSPLGNNGMPMETYENKV